MDVRAGPQGKLSTEGLTLSNCAREDLDSKIKPVNPKGKQPWIFIGRTDAEAETPILWPPDAKSWFIGKDPDVGKDWRQEEKGVTEDERVGWHHWLNGHEFEQTLGDNDGQESLVCCSSRGHKESDMTEWWNNNSKTWCRKIRGSLLSQRLEHRQAAFTLQHEKEFWTFLGFCVSNMRLSSSHFTVTSYIC